MPDPVSTTTPARRLRRVVTAALVLLAAALGGPGQGRAATLTVIGDVNAGAADNLRLYENVLAGGRNVLFARGFGQMTGVVGRYRSIGANPVSLSGPLNAAALSGRDLLVLTTTYNTAFDFSAAELAAARDYGLAGGRILFVAEAGLVPILSGYNDVLAALGARIRFATPRHVLTEVVTDIAESDITAGLTAFRVSPHNTLTGGTAAVRATNGAAVAFETLGAPAPVPLPAAGALLVGGLGLLHALRRWRRHPGPEAGTSPGTPNPA